MPDINTLSPEAELIKPKPDVAVPRRRLTIDELMSRIHYPPRRRAKATLHSLSTPIGRRALEIYHQSQAARYGSERRLKMSVTNKDRSPQRSGAAGSGSVAANVLRTIAAGGAAPDPGYLDAKLTELLEIIATGGDKDASNYLGVAAILAIKGRYTDAIEYYTRSTKVDPMRTEAYLRRAECYTRMDAPHEALEEYKKYMQLEPATKELLVQSGKCALDADALDEAEDLFIACLGLEEKDADIQVGGQFINDSYALYNLGEVEERRGDNAKAREYYARVDPAFTEPYYLQGKHEFNAGNYPLALRLFEAVSKVTPESVGVHLWLADTYTALGPEFSLCVLTCLTNAIQLPEPPHSGDVPEEPLDYGVEAVDDEGIPLYYSGGCHLQPTLLRRGLLHLDVLGDTEQAIRDFTMCLARNPHNADALLSRARALLQRHADGDEPVAMADYRTLVDLPNVPIAVKAGPYAVLGSDAEARGELDKASRYFSLAIVAGYDLAANPAPTARVLYRCMLHCVAARPHDALCTYAPRGYGPRQDDSEVSKGGRGPVKGKNLSSDGPLRSAPVSTACYALGEAWYHEVRSREPTVHRADETELLAQWDIYRREIEHAREEAEIAKTGKNAKKKR